MFKKALFLALALSLILSVVPVSVSFAFTDFSENYDTAINNTVNPGESVVGITPEQPGEWWGNYNSSKVDINVIDGALGKKTGDKSIVYRQFQQVGESALFPYSSENHPNLPSVSLAVGDKATYKANIFIPDMRSASTNAMSFQTVVCDANGDVIRKTNDEIQFKGSNWISTSYRFVNPDGSIPTNASSTDIGNARTSAPIKVGYDRMQWYSVAAVVEANTVTMYIDGVKLYTALKAVLPGEYVARVNMNFKPTTLDWDEIPADRPNFMVFDDIEVKSTSDINIETEALYNPEASNTEFGLAPGAPFYLDHPTYTGTGNQPHAQLVKVVSGTTVGELLAAAIPAQGGEVYAVKYVADVYDQDFIARKSNPANPFPTTVLDDNAIIDLDTKIVSIAPDKSMKVYKVAEIVAADASNPNVASVKDYDFNGSSVSELPEYVTVENFLKKVRTVDPRAKKEIYKNTDLTTPVTGVMISGYTLRITSVDKSITKDYPINFERQRKIRSDHNNQWGTGSESANYVDGNILYQRVVQDKTTETGKEALVTGALPTYLNATPDLPSLAADSTVSITVHKQPNRRGFVIANDSDEMFRIRHQFGGFNSRMDEYVTTFNLTPVQDGKFVYSTSLVKSGDKLSGEYNYKVTDIPMITAEDGKFWYDGEPIAYCNEGTTYKIAVAVGLPKLARIKDLVVRKIWINGVVVVEAAKIPIFDLSGLDDSGYGLCGSGFGVQGAYLLDEANSDFCGLDGYNLGAAGIDVTSSVYDLDLFQTEKFSAPVITGSFATVADLKAGLTTNASIAVKNLLGEDAQDTDAVVDGMSVELSAGTGSMVTKAIYYTAIPTFTDANGVAASIAGSAGNTFTFNKPTYLNDDIEVILAAYNANGLADVDVYDGTAPSVTFADKTNAKIKAIYFKSLSEISPVGDYEELN